MKLLKRFVPLSPSLFIAPAFSALLLTAGWVYAETLNLPVPGKVSPDYPEQYQRPLPELVAFNREGQCTYYSTGFDEQNFEKELARFIRGEQKELVPYNEKMAQAVRQSILADDRIPENSKQRVIDASLTHMQANAKHCQIDMKDTIAMIDLEDGDLDLGTLVKDATVIVEYSADWCVPCRQQEKVITEYLKVHPEVVGSANLVWFKVERDMNKLSEKERMRVMKANQRVNETP